MPHSKIRTITIRGRECHIFVSEQGVFYCDPDRSDGSTPSELDTLEARTLVELTKKIEERFRTKPAAIPFVRWQDEENIYTNWNQRGATKRIVKPSYLRRGTIKGLHRSNGNVLYYWNDDPKKETQQGHKYGGGSFYWMTEADEAEYVRLQKLLEKTDKEIKALENKSVLDIAEELNKKRVKEKKEKA